MNIAIIRFERFPYGSAPAFRALQMMKLLCTCGHSVTVIAKDINSDAQFYEQIERDYPVRCISVDNEFGSSYRKAISSVLCYDSIDAVLCPTSIHHFCEVHTTLKAFGVPIVFDSVEWYDSSNWRLQYADPRYYFFQYLWRHCFGRADGIIAISRLIQEYFIHMEPNVVRIPTITDCENTESRVELQSKTVRFVFAGQLDNGKDNIDTFIEALHRVDPKGEQTQMDIYGQNILQVKKHLDGNAGLLDIHPNIIIHGKVSQKEAQEACLNSDFSVFFRLNRRSANAGFPTKLGECMTFGTPAICNDTGDISLVVKNRINGYLLKTKSVDEIADALRHILSLSVEEREAMRREARKSAEEFFDYRNYQEEIQKVLENAVKGRK